MLESIRKAAPSSYRLPLGNLNTPSLVRLTTAVLEVNCHPLPEPLPLTKASPFSVTSPDVDSANVYVPETRVEVVLLPVPLTKASPFSVTLPAVDRANVYVPATSVEVVPTSIFESCVDTSPKLALILVNAVLRLSPSPALVLLPVFTYNIVMF